MAQDRGASLRDRAGGLRPEPAAQSQPEALIPSAIFSPMTYQSCPICFGSRVAFDAACQTCADPDPAIARKVLERLGSDQMRFLRAFGHTLANQPVTGEEWDTYALCEFWVDDDDGVSDPEDYGWLISPTRLWFANSQASMRYGSLATFVRYNPLGLLLRECLMAGADAMVRAPASAMSASGQDPQGLEAKPASAVQQADAK